jgi:hypothetical protein
MKLQCWFRNGQVRSDASWFPILMMPPQVASCIDTIFSMRQVIIADRQVDLGQELAEKLGSAASFVK